MANNDETNGAAGAEKTGFEDKSMDELKVLLESEQDVEAQKNINRELFGRTSRAEAKLKEGKDRGTPPTVRTDNEDGDDKGAPWEEFAELQAAGYSPAEIVELGKLAKQFHITPREVIANPIMKAGFEAARKKANVGSRTMAPDRRSSGGVAPVSQGNDNDKPGIKAGRDAFNRNLSTGSESSE